MKDETLVGELRQDLFKTQAVLEERLKEIKELKNKVRSSYAFINAIHANQLLCVIVIYYYGLTCLYILLRIITFTSYLLMSVMQ